MTIDERLEALTMNLELTARDVADLQKAVSQMQATTAGIQATTAEMQATTAEMQAATAEMQASTAAFQKATAERFALWELESKHLDEKVDSLADSTKMLLIAVQAHQSRIERLEHRAS
jgi:chromosome segregation ATPase